MTTALQLSDTTIPLTIYTDCMAVIAMITRWKKGDWQPRLEDKVHPDLILTAIHALHARAGSETMIVW
eukprot:3076535-Rhodomonas_salina.1